MMLDIKIINMMKMMKIRNQIIIYFILDFILILFSMYKGTMWLLNTQIAFASALLIILLSFLSYIKNVNKQVKVLADKIDERDYIDELDDPYELYDENNTKKKPNKAKISVKNLSKSRGAAFSLYRILGYIVLIIGFLMLVKLKSIVIIAYILGISIIPLGTILSSLTSRS